MSVLSSTRFDFPKSALRLPPFLVRAPASERLVARTTAPTQGTRFKTRIQASTSHRSTADFVLLWARETARKTKIRTDGKCEKQGD
jgi:hypothetical protein